MSDVHITWAQNMLLQSGYRIQKAIPESILKTPWSEVCRFITDRGFIYLKKVPSKLAQEINIGSLWIPGSYATNS